MQVRVRRPRFDLNRWEPKRVGFQFELLDTRFVQEHHSCQVSLVSLKLYSMRDTTLQFTSVWWRQWRCAWSQSLAALRIFGAFSEGWEP